MSQASAVNTLVDRIIKLEQDKSKLLSILNQTERALRSLEQTANKLPMEIREYVQNENKNPDSAAIISNDSNSDAIKELTESIAALNHEDWTAMTKTIHNMIDNYNTNGMASNHVIAKAFYDKWSDKWKPYSELDEHAKELCRFYAREVIELLHKRADELKTRIGIDRQHKQHLGVTWDIPAEKTVVSGPGNDLSTRLAEIDKIEKIIDSGHKRQQKKEDEEIDLMDD